MAKAKMTKAKDLGMARAAADNAALVAQAKARKAAEAKAEETKEETTMATTKKATTGITVEALAARIDAQDKALSDLVNAVKDLTLALAGQARMSTGADEAPTVKTTAKKSDTKAKAKKSDTKATAKKSDTKATRKAPPTKEEWLTFKAAHKAEVASLPTKHLQNSALYKMYMAS